MRTVRNGVYGFKMARKYMNRDLLIVYVKNPEEGRVKSRLIPQLGEYLATSVYSVLLKNLSNVLNILEIPVRISHDGKFPEKGLNLKVPHSRSEQSGKDLGERMYNDLFVALKEGYERVCLVGSDIPNLDGSIISKAFESLNDNDLVLGPTFDGGYYLIGIHRDTHLKRKWFQGIPWSTSTVLDDTINKLSGYKINYGLLPLLRDLDTPEDLEKFPDLLEEVIHPKV